MASDLLALRDLPPVRALAEKQAREFLNALSGPAVTWETMPDTPESRRIKERHVETHLRLLTDLSRPASMDALARLVAAKVGIECGATAPELRQVTVALPDGTESNGWALLGAPGEQYLFFDRNVPGISAITDPAEALARVAIAVLA